MNNIFVKLINLFFKLEEQATNYILIPRKVLLITAIKLNLIMFFMYFVSVNILFTVELICIYSIIIYMYFLFFKICAKYRYRLSIIIPFIIISQLPSWYIATCIRKSIINLF